MENIARRDPANRIRFWCRKEKAADRPDIMTAVVLDMTTVGDTDLSFLSDNQQLRVLYLSEVHALRGIEHLAQVRELVLYHLPKVHSLEPLAALSGLQILTISTPASWDVSRKCIEVDSLKPLRTLKRLISLDLCGVRPREGGLRPLWELTKLQRLEISHVYTFGLQDYAELAAHLPGAVGSCLRPCFRMGFATPCRRCGKQMVCLVGARPRAHRLLCVDCDRIRLEAHIEAWRASSLRAFPYPTSAEDVRLEAPFHWAGIRLRQERKRP